MAKKRRSNKRVHRRPLWLSVRLVAVSFTLLLAGIGLLFNNIVNKPAVCANSISCIRDLSGRYEDNQEGIFMGRKVTAPSYIAQAEPQQRVLGQNIPNQNKHIYIDLGNQVIKAYEGEKLVYSFPVATGKWGPTPTGDFHIWVKLRYTRMAGGEGADYYNLPNVPYVMFFANSEVGRGRGFSIHGAYWHNNFGRPMSHGCVNMREEDVAKIYDWANPATQGLSTYATADDPGTLVTIYGTPPEL